MNNITLRPAVAADQATIMRLVFQNQLNGVGIGWRNFTVAQDEHGKFVGCGQIRPHGAIDELASLMVVAERQGSGVSNLLMDALIERGRRPLWLMCESPLTKYYTRYGFHEVQDPSLMPGYFRSIYWLTRATVGVFLSFRGTHVAFMCLEGQTQL